MSDEMNTDKPERSEDAAKAAAFLDPEGENEYKAPEEEKIAFLEPDADASAPEEEKVAFLEPDSDSETAASVEETVVIADPEPQEEATPAPVRDDDEDDPSDEEPAITLNEAPDDGIKRRWYAIHAHSGQEATVQRSLISGAEQQGLTDLLTNVLVPMEEVAEFKSGEKKFTKRKYFPGYLLVQLPEHPERYADLWHLIKDTTGVTGFIGSRNEPVPLEDSEVMSLVEEIRGERERPRAKVNFDIGERIKIIDGAFSNFFGNIGEINEERGKMKVMIEIFERQTSVEVEFWQVEKI
ncbi:MAG: transcription termination/antitermination protein NusG [Candidatus Hydrogenedentota bacterium]